MRGSEAGSVARSPVPKEALFPAHREPGADVGKHGHVTCAKCLVQVGTQQEQVKKPSHLWEKVRTSASKSELDSFRSEASRVATGSSLQEGWSRRPAPSPWPRLPPPSRTSTPAGPWAAARLHQLEAQVGVSGPPSCPCGHRAGFLVQWGSWGHCGGCGVLAAPALNRERKKVAELPASTGRTLLASRRPRRHGRHGDSCLGHLSSPAEAPQCPEDPRDEMWERGDPSTGGELCPGSLLRSALEDRSEGPRCSSWPRRDPDWGLSTCSSPPGCTGSSHPRVQPRVHVRRFNHRLEFRQSLSVGAERGPAASPCTLRSKLLICAAEASKIKWLFGKC